jgi:hypothetical protein
MRSFSLPVRPIKAWSTEEIQQLRQLAIAGESPEAIAMKLRRSASAIRNKATMHGISLKSRSHDTHADSCCDDYDLPQAASSR